ncbi:DUF5724 domain-containing protein [Leptolyngbya sp. FACHB-8]|uniref:DUF5724 domain-containing protein n=1 Tax=unclassified Leptolyngbya TaxID=2650499 RepID=UPI001682748E|nr:DUF5724 domain-containing protein [Leptolyngbya sp. FACHB-8]MBD1909122.1 DUF4132 domain-containing protein [Leptolyngbya sp. FACHB-8]
MLNREVAQAQLKKLYLADWKSQRVQRLADLPEGLRIVGRGILGYGADGQNLNAAELYQLQEQFYRQLDQLAPSDRLQIFCILFPKFAATVEAAWQLLGQLPYQSGHSRRSFRTPAHPELSAAKRYQWFQQFVYAVEGYDQDLEWFAAWAPYLPYYYATDVLGILFAAAIAQNDELGHALFTVLTASASNNHEIGAMGRHVTRALLMADRLEGWEFIERLLLAAQRQEGLRQSILETIDEAHPIAFKRMLRLILEQKLTRFSATIRAIDVWFGFGLESLDEKTAQQFIGQVLELLENPDAQSTAMASEDPQLVYLALWAAGFIDAVAAIDLAVLLLDHSEATHRFVAVHFLGQLEITPARFMLLSAVSDRDLSVATAAVQALARTGDTTIQQDSDLFERLEQVLPHFPAKPQTRSMVWQWIKLEPSQALVASVLQHNLGERSPKRLIPYLPLLDPYGRSNVAKLLSDIKPWDAEIRTALFQLLADASSWVREQVLRLLQPCEITPAESIELEQLLTRTASDLRRGILGLLLSQPDEAAIASAERLLAAKKAPQRQAGLELLRELVQQQRLLGQAQQLATAYQARPKLTVTETQLLTAILESKAEATLTDALGLVQVQDLTPIAPLPTIAATQIVTDSATSCLSALDELIHEHRQTPVKISWNGEEEELLGNLTWKFPQIDPKLSQEQNLERLPLSDVWLNWWRDRDEATRDVDGLELVRAIAPRFNYRPDPYGREKTATDQASLPERVLSELQSQVGQTNSSLRYPDQINSIIRWLLYLHPSEQTFVYCLDAITLLLNTIPIHELKDDPQWGLNQYWGVRGQIASFIGYWLRFARTYSSTANAEQCTRWWHLVRWIDRHLPSYQAMTTIWDIYEAYQVGGAREADLVFHLLGAEERMAGTAQPVGNPAEAKANLRTSFPDLSQLTRRNLGEYYTAHPFLLELVDRARQRILMIELQRGDLPTAASHAARALRSIVGMTTVIQLIQAFDCNKLVRHYTYNSLSKAAIFSHLMRISFPAAEDTPAEFSQRVQSAQIKPEKLVQFAFYAPQWVNYIEHTLGWSGFTEAIWWFHAHTKDNGWTVEPDVRETWVAQISERTPLSAQILVDGAVDVEWFHRLYKLLGADRWNQLYEAAQYASSGAGHQRAKLFADAMLGNLESQNLRDRMTKKRHQDSVRALGLLPLPEENRDREILNRYQTLQDFLRTSKKFGSQRQASEKLAVSIGMENLARTAGFVDPQRLQWAMEAEAIADLSEQAQTVTVDQVSVSLSITAKGEPEVTITKQGKPLKAIPAKLKKQPEIQALTNRKQEITQQASRIRISLEQAMCRGDRFTAAELVQLAKHPVLFPMLSQLVLIGNTESGYLVEQGTALRNHSQVVTPITSTELRIAHPHDLLATQEWHLWQQDCFVSDRVQPFKQIFRELYVLTGAEQSKTISRRYEGHQVSPKQALALWGQRGWVAAPEEGVRRTFHTEGLVAEVDFADGFYTPLEVEGLTIAGVRFRSRDKWQPMPLCEVSPRLFSEVMRDLDLVVSVAHQGGVDPEATASTVEMRSALVRETCRLLKLNNVQLQSSHALIEGQLGSYSVHLGSAMVHRQPGGALCIMPAHSQHRGRLFLPFVDPDPKTAEVVSKILLLARDKEIQDPTILQQIL